MASPALIVPHTLSSAATMNGEATDGQDIPRVDKLSRSVSNSWNSLSTSPTFAFHPPPARRTSTITKQLKPFATKDIKVLLLENINQTGQEILRGEGYIVEALKSSLPEDQLIEKIRYGHLHETLED